ncbi:MAG: hypothetical protein ACE5IO_07820, partial [Thermoplasmata archaeon]
MEDSHLRIAIENVCGFHGHRDFDLQPGINRIRAPNAVGKTSFVRALELLTSDERQLRGKGYYMNLFALSPREQAVVTLEGALSLKRRFRRAGSDLLPVEGEPLLPGLSDAVQKICFAVPENELINTMLAGKPIRSYVEQLSDSNLYDGAVAALEDVRSDLEQQHQMYRADLIRLEETERAIKGLSESLDAKRVEIKSAPEVDETRIMRDRGTRQLYEQKAADRQKIERELTGLRRKFLEKEAEADSLRTEIDFYRQSLRGIGADRERIERELSDLNSKLQERKQEANNIRLELAKIDDELRLVNENFQKRRKYGEEKLCIACGQPLTLKQLQDWESQLREASADFQRKMRESSRTIEQLEDEEEALEEKLQRLSTFQDRLKQAERTLAVVERESARQKKEVETAESSRAELDSEIASLYKAIDKSVFELWKRRLSLTDSIAELEARLQSLQSRAQGFK